MLNILHLEDSDDDAELIFQALRRALGDCQVKRVETRQTFVDAIDKSDWDLILADYSLPSFDGILALKLAVEKRPDIPFIFVTGSLGEDRAVESLKNGATDYVPKHRLHRLHQAVTRAMREAEASKAKTAVERKLKASLREKELLLQEVHHRVKNNLQVICSLLDMQSRTMNDPLLAAALEEGQLRIRSMAMIHDMLYASARLNDIDFGEYAQLLASQVGSSYGVDPARIQFVFDLEPTRLEIDRAIPCGLILNELLSNALKYAFPNGGGGQIRISLRQREHCIWLTVEDTGVGLVKGHSGESKSLGLSIVNVLVEQLGGNMEISSSPGACFALRFSPRGRPDTVQRASEAVVAPA